MNDKMEKPKRRHILRSMILFCLLLMVATVGVSYALGWISFRRGEDTFTIEIRTGKVKQDADHAVKKSKDAAAETGKVLQNAGKKLEELGDEGKVEPADSSPADEPAVPAKAKEPRIQPEQTIDE